MHIDNLLILTKHLRSHLALVHPDGPKSAEEQREARSKCETLIQSLEALVEEVETELGKQDEQLH